MAENKKGKYEKPVSLDAGKVFPAVGAYCGAGSLAVDGCGYGNNPDLVPACTGTGSEADTQCNSNGADAGSECNAHGEIASSTCDANGQSASQNCQSNGQTAAVFCGSGSSATYGT